MPERNDSESMDEAWNTKQTPDDLARLGTFHTSWFWPPLRQIILRLKGSYLAKMENPAAPLEEIRISQGAMAFANEILEFVEKDAPSAYERSQKKHEDEADDNP